MTLYLVSGAPDIVPADGNLRRTGRRVKFDTQVSNAVVELVRGDRRFVVIAHGRSDGTVMWFRSDTATAARWLWVGMRPAPRGARIYLYTCNAGPRMAHFLKRCECFGHSSPVPMPIDPVDGIVVRFLDKVDELMSSPLFDARAWRKDLSEFVNSQWLAEVEMPTSYVASSAWQMLSQSLRD